MRGTNWKPKASLIILTIISFGISSVFISCGSSEDDDVSPTPPTDEIISTDQPLILAVNSSRTVNIIYDTHTISASSENTAVATVSVADAILTITGIAVGSTTVTITATDSSGAEPVFFDVTVIEPQVIASTPSPLTDISLQGSVVTLTLVGLIYDSTDDGNLIKVSGIPDLRLSIVEYVSRTELRFGLSHGSQVRYPSDAKGRFQGEVIDNIRNIDTDATLTFTVAAAAIAGYNGPPLTAQIPVAGTIDIQGPWLWMAVPTDPNLGRGVSTEFDSLAAASNNGVTETDVAIRGVNEGDIIGQFQWRSGSIGYTHGTCEEFCEPALFGGCTILCWWNNISETLNTLGFGAGGDMKGYTAYALINLIAPSDQDNAMIGVKSSDAIKIWLNGEAIHREDATALECRSIAVDLAWDPKVCTPDSARPTGYSIPVKLRAGDNLLLVKVRQHGDYWGMVVALAADFTTSIPKRLR